MSCITAPQNPCLAVGETATAGYSFKGRLADGETISTIVIAEITTVDLTFTGENANTVEVEIAGEEVPIGQAVLYTVTGAVANTNYRYRITITTGAGQTLHGIARIRGVSNT